MFLHSDLDAIARHADLFGGLTRSGASPQAAAPRAQADAHGTMQEHAPPRSHSSDTCEDFAEVDDRELELQVLAADREILQEHLMFVESENVALQERLNNAVLETQAYSQALSDAGITLEQLGMLRVTDASGAWTGQEGQVAQSSFGFGNGPGVASGPEKEASLTTMPTFSAALMLQPQSPHQQQQRLQLQQPGANHHTNGRDGDGGAGGSDEAAGADDVVLRTRVNDLQSRVETAIETVMNKEQASLVTTYWHEQDHNNILA